MISTFLIPKVLIPATLFWLITFTSDQKTPWNLFLVSCINLFIDFDFLIVNLYRKMVFNSLNSLIVINFTSSTFYLHGYTQTIWFTFAMKKKMALMKSVHIWCLRNSKQKYAALKCCCTSLGFLWEQHIACHCFLSLVHT